MTEKRLERLNYYNGQRLEAEDLKLEQEYHIRVRRWLNKSLYTAGIARGLEVRAEKGTTTVVISPGLALDSEGREILLLEEVRMPVVGRGSTVEGDVEGNYLVIEYNEQVTAEDREGCATPPKQGKPGAQLAWGGPARILARPTIKMTDVLPYETSGQIVLAQIELNGTCSEVRHVHTGIRDYVGAASSAKVRQYALEGFRDVDAANSQKFFFHVRGRQPNAVTLYLKAEKFPTLYYTEMGQHKHPISVKVDSLTLAAHKHVMPKSKSDAGTDHKHTIAGITADTDEGLWKSVLGIIGGLAPAPQGVAALALLTAHEAASGGVRALSVSLRPFKGFPGDNLAARANMTIDVDDENLHTHGIPAETNNYPAAGNDTTFPLSGSGGSDPVGVSVPARTAGDPLTFVDDLHVWIDNQDCTADILRQLVALRPSAENWSKLGNGDPGGSHTLATKGTGPIRLDFLPGVVFDEREHVIEFKVASGGGRILYNLYVE